MTEFNSNYEIKIDFNNYVTDPQRIFQSMADLISDFKELDSILTESFPVVSNIEIQLEAIEVGSIKARLKTVLELIPDEALKELNWRLIIGSYLVKAKHIILGEMSETNTINSKETIENIKQKVAELSNEQVGYKATLSSKKLLENISKMSNTLKNLNDNESAFYISSSGAVVLNKQFNLTFSQIEDLLVSDIEAFETNVKMQIKKPDYTGSSKWDFHLSGQIVSVKVKDHEWLGKFKSGQIVLRPGDGVEALIRVERRIDQVGLVLSESFELLKVKRILHSSEYRNEQLSLLSSKLNIR